MTPYLTLVVAVFAIFIGVMAVVSIWSNRQS